MSLHVNSPRFLRLIYLYCRLILLGVLLALLVRESVIEAYRIPSDSMRNTLLAGDFLLAEKLTFGARIPFTDLRLPGIRDPERGDVVVFQFPSDPSKTYVKRVVAVGGR